MKLIVIYEMADVALASTYCTLRTCEELAFIGQDVELWVLPKKKLNFNAALELYGRRPKFRTRLFNNYIFFNGNRFLYTLYFIYWGMRSLFKIEKDSVILTRDLNIAALLIILRKKVFYDIQSKPVGRFGQLKLVLDKAVGIIVKSEVTRRLFTAWNCSTSKILLFRNRVRLEEFNIQITKAEARKKTMLPEDKIIIGYAGNLKTENMDQGITTALQALNHLGEDYLLCLVGGSDSNVKEYKEKAEKLGVGSKVFFTGYQKHDLIPIYLKAFDVLIAPYPAREHNMYYMCPVKLFEYMASSRPIIVTDLPSVREFLNDNQVAFIQPEEPEILSRKIEELIKDEELSKKLCKNAFDEVKKYSWRKGAEEIVSFIHKTDAKE